MEVNPSGPYCLPGFQQELSRVHPKQVYHPSGTCRLLGFQQEPSRFKPTEVTPRPIEVFYSRLCLLGSQQEPN